MSDACDILTVSALTDLIKAAIEDGVPPCRVMGELSNARPNSSGHFYFKLKDPDGTVLPGVMFRGDYARLAFRPADGDRVVCHGRVDLYKPYGSYQFIARGMTAHGAGDLMRKFEQLKARLRAEGLFDESRKRPLPLLPETVGVVTSPSGAAVCDIVRTITDRLPNVRIVLYPVRVQGSGAAAEIARGLDWFGQPGRADVVIVGRGGGSIEDLLAFNEEEVARAIVRCPVPVVSAVGHETDFTIADFAADLRAPTPTAAGERVVPDREELTAALAEHRRRLTVLISARSASCRESLDGRRRGLRPPQALVAEYRLRLDALIERAGRAAERSLSMGRTRFSRLQSAIERNTPAASVPRARDRLAADRRQLAALGASLLAGNRSALDRMGARLQALDPEAVLARGYSITLREGKGITDAALLSPGDPVETILHRGRFISTVAGGRDEE